MNNTQWDKVAAKVSFTLEVDLVKFASYVEKNAQILDFGCGYGRISNQLIAEGFCNIKAIDASKGMIARAVVENPGVEFSLLVDKLLPYSSNQFDAIVVCAVFTCMPRNERELYIKELKRVLKPDGILHLVEFCAEQSRSFLSKFDVTMWYGSTADIEELIVDFRVVDAHLLEARTVTAQKVQSYSLFARKH